MSSPKLPWSRLWSTLWSLIPEPAVKGRLLLALDDYINPKAGKKIFGCASFFDHADKINQSKFAWSQNVVSIGLLTVVFRLMARRFSLEPNSSKPLRCSVKSQSALPIYPYWS
jgi:hypothetical protein